MDKQDTIYYKKKIAELGVEIASKILGLSELEILYKNIEFFSNGDINSMFIKSHYYIIFKDEWIEAASDYEIFASAFHETRHAYQMAQVEFPNLMKCNEPQEITAKWDYELNNYYSSKGVKDKKQDKAYLSQDIEIDAIAFEQYLLKRLLNSNLVPHEVIAEEVYKKRLEFEEQYKDIDLPTL